MFEQPRELALHLPQRLLALRLRLGCDQIGEPLDRGEIEPSVLERAASELTGLGVTETVERRERAEHRGDYGMAAMHLQFGHVFTGLALRARKP